MSSVGVAGVLQRASTPGRGPFFTEIRPPFRIYYPKHENELPSDPPSAGPQEGATYVFPKLEEVP